MATYPRIWWWAWYRWSHRGRWTIINGAISPNTYADAFALGKNKQPKDHHSFLIEDAMLIVWPRTPPTRVHLIDWQSNLKG